MSKTVFVVVGKRNKTGFPIRPISAEVELVPEMAMVRVLSISMM
jgi:hypothetical protein